MPFEISWRYGRRSSSPGTKSAGGWRPKDPDFGSARKNRFPSTRSTSSRRVPSARLHGQLRGSRSRCDAEDLAEGGVSAPDVPVGTDGENRGPPVRWSPGGTRSDPLGVMRPIFVAALISPNQILPSGPKRWLLARPDYAPSGSGNSVMVPVGVMRPILLPASGEPEVAVGARGDARRAAVGRRDRELAGDGSRRRHAPDLVRRRTR